MGNRVSYISARTKNSSISGVDSRWARLRLDIPAPINEVAPTSLTTSLPVAKTESSPDDPTTKFECSVRLGAPAHVPKFLKWKGVVLNYATVLHTIYDSPPLDLIVSQSNPILTTQKLF